MSCLRRSSLPVHAAPLRRSAATYFRFAARLFPAFLPSSPQEFLREKVMKRFIGVFLVRAAI